MTFTFPKNTDDWLLAKGPQHAVVISSRARLARNLPNLRFAPRANEEQLRFVADKIGEIFKRNQTIGRYRCYDLAEASPVERCFMRESHLISTELEKGGVGRLVFLNPSMDVSMMVNEEDHLRISTLGAGFCLRQVHRNLTTIEKELEQDMDLAYSEEFGYLTACPTNTGTGLRLSVMLHLPALAMIEQIEDALSPLGSYGMVVRGTYGEHSQNIGDLYQISNEVTLGKSEQQILDLLERLVVQIVEREVHARHTLLTEAHDRLEDVICRAVGVLSTARNMDSAEAVTLLSRTRLGIGQSWGLRIDHQRLNRLFVDIQPAHLQYLQHASPTPDERDKTRAIYLRSIFVGNGEKGPAN